MPTLEPVAEAAATRRATALGAGAIALWSTLAVLTTASDAVPPFQLMATAFAVGAAVGMALLLRRGGIAGLAVLRQPMPAFILTTAALAGYHALYFVALTSAPPVEANLINYLWPLLIVVFAALLRLAPAAPRHFAGTALGLLGAALIVTRGEGIGMRLEHLPGYAAALGAALVWSLYSVLNRRHAGVASAAIAGPCLATAALGAVAHLAFEDTVAPTTNAWLAMIAMGAGPVGAAFWLWDIGTKRGDIAALGVLAYATPLMSTLLLLLAGAAEPHWSQAAACALIVGGGMLGLRAPPAPRRTRTG